MSPGGVAISEQARVEAVHCLLYAIGTDLTPGEAAATVDYAAARFERDEVAGALATLRAACDLTGAYRLAAVLHTAGRKGAGDGC